MFYLFSMLFFKSSRIFVAIVFRRRLELKYWPALWTFGFEKPKPFGVKPGDCR